MKSYISDIDIIKREAPEIVISSQHLTEVARFCHIKEAIKGPIKSLAKLRMDSFTFYGLFSPPKIHQRILDDEKNRWPVLTLGTIADVLFSEKNKLSIR